MQNYDIRYDDKYGQLAQIDVAAEGAGYEPWVNQTLTSVNDSVVRLAVIEGELARTSGGRRRARRAPSSARLQPGEAWCLESAAAAEGEASFRVLVTDRGDSRPGQAAGGDGVTDPARRPYA
jgi:hypothetical protein